MKNRQDQGICCGNRRGGCPAERSRTRGRAVRRLLVAGAVGTAVMLTGAAAAAVMRVKGLDDAESAAVELLPGDELVPHGYIVATRSIEIIAPPEGVWPWLAQIGQDKAGFYSWTALENLVGIGMPEVHRIVPAWQGLEAGDPVRFSDGLAVVAARVEPPHVLVMHGDPQAAAAGRGIGEGA